MFRAILWVFRLMFKVQILENGWKALSQLSPLITSLASAPISFTESFSRIDALVPLLLNNPRLLSCLAAPTARCLFLVSPYHLSWEASCKCVCTCYTSMLHFSPICISNHAYLTILSWEEILCCINFISLTLI